MVQRMPLSTQRVHHQAFRFLLVGATTVAIDFVVYQLLHLLGVPLTPAKTASFVVSAVCAFQFNRSFTFNARGGRMTAARFFVLYLLALVVNVSVNAAGLALLAGRLAGQPRIVLAFLVAQGVSSTMNFFGMRHLVFTDRD